MGVGSSVAFPEKNREIDGECVEMALSDGRALLSRCQPAVWRELDAWGGSPDLPRDFLASLNGADQGSEAQGESC